MIGVNGLRVHRGDTFTLEIEALTLGDELVAVMGPNGAGKSTLLETLAGRLAHEGTIEAGTTWYLAPSPPARTVVDVADVVRAHGTGDARTWLDRVGYAGPRSLAHGSSGERMLVAIAGALARDGDHLLLDEPFGPLDPPHVAGLVPLLREHASRRGVVLTTHDPMAAAQADRVVLLAGGVTADGPPDAVLRSGPLSHCYGARIDVVWTELGPAVRAGRERMGAGP